jgi:hypothetical protein
MNVYINSQASGIQSSYKLVTDETEAGDYYR